MRWDQGALGEQDEAGRAHARALPPRWVNGQNIAAGILLALLLLFFGLFVVFEAPVKLAFGVLTFPLRVVRHVDVSWSGVATFVVLVVLLVTAGHRVLRGLAARLGRPREWPLRNTVAIVAGTTWTFVVVIATTGLLHHLAWLVLSGQPVLDWGRDGRTRPCRQAMRAYEDAGAGIAELVSDPRTHVIFLTPPGSSDHAVLVYPRDPLDLEIEGGFACQNWDFEALPAAEVRELVALIQAGLPVTLPRSDSD